MAGVGLADPPDLPALRIRGLCKSFVHHLRGGTVQSVLDAVDLDVASGSMVVLTGPSGAGKSSLLRCIYRTYLPDSGSIQLHLGGGRTVDLAAADERTVLQVRASTLHMVTQFLSVVPRVAAVDLVAHAFAHTEAPPNSASDPPAARERARDRLIGLGLSPDRVADPPATFSGGERQIVNLATALAHTTGLGAGAVLLLDEATAALDPVRRELVLDALVAEKDRGTTIVAVFHDVPDRPGLVDRVLHVTDQRLTERTGART